MDEWSTLEISCSLSALASSHTWALTHKKHDHLGPESSFQAYYGTTNMHYSHCFVHPPSFSAEQPDKAWANTNCRRRRVMEWNGWLKRINSPWHPCIDMECSCVTWYTQTYCHAIHRKGSQPKQERGGIQCSRSTLCHCVCMAPNRWSIFSSHPAAAAAECRMGLGVHDL